MKKEEIVLKEDPVICVMGLGYVGLPTALHFAKNGFRVLGFDVDEKKIAMLNEGKLPFFDVGLEVNYDDARETEKITFTTDERKIAESDVILVIVPTPVDERKIPDLKYIISAGEQIGKNLKEGAIIVLESTVYPGTTEEVLAPTIEKFSKKKQGKEFYMGYVPERYNPGDEKHTIITVNRVISGENEQIAAYLAKIYGKVIKAEIHVARDIKTAEASKVIENTQRDLNIALMNEIALICEKIGIDVMDVIEAAKTKWNFVPYYPGAGVGGHCLPHDPFYLTMKAKELGYEPYVILAGRRINDTMPKHMVELLQEELNEQEKALKKRKIVILGAAYKEETGDLRSAPTEIVVEELKKKGSEMILVDPFIEEKELWGVKVVQKVEDIQEEEEIDAIMLITHHKEFTEEKILEIKKRSKNKEIVLIDGRRKLDKERMVKEFRYRGLGSSRKEREI